MAILSVKWSDWLKYRKNECSLDISYQKNIDEATAALNKELDELIYKPADISAAVQMIATANNIDRSLYEDMSLAALTAESSVSTIMVRPSREAIIVE